METAVIYARYSSDNQTEQSIEGQLRVCEDYAKRNGILIVNTYIDRAMTGTNDRRPDFQRMIKDSAKHSWNIVLVYKLDRFSRNKYETAIHKKTLKDNGVRVVSAMENIPDTPEGIILESLLEGSKQQNGHNGKRRLFQTKIKTTKNKAESSGKFQCKVRAIPIKTGLLFYVISALFLPFASPVVARGKSEVNGKNFYL